MKVLLAYGALFFAYEHLRLRDEEDERLAARKADQILEINKILSNPLYVPREPFIELNYAALELLVKRYAEKSSLHRQRYPRNGCAVYYS
jgi:hypothetical protein